MSRFNEAGYCWLNVCMQAVELPAGSLERQLQVAAFALSFCTGNTRSSKPCPPMLGETYEIMDSHKRCVYLCQEVGACSCGLCWCSSTASCLILRGGLCSYKGPGSQL